MVGYRGVNIRNVAANQMDAKINPTRIPVKT